MTKTESAAPDIEAVYPLREVQRALLVHHAARPERDEGLIQTSFILSGELRVEALLLAWERVTREYAALRGSVHWKNMSAPVWMVRTTVSLDWRYADWSDRSRETADRQWRELLREDRAEPLPLERAPVGRWLIRRQAPDRHYFAWTCHHLLLDGWSGQTVLDRVMAIYAELVHPGSEVTERRESMGYPHYLHWRKAQPLAEAEAYWRTYLDGIDIPLRLPSAGGESQRVALQLSRSVSTALATRIREAGLTVNACVQGLWASLLGRLTGRSEVTFGLTVSGRPAELAGSDRLVGMFANVIPRRVKLSSREPNTFLHTVQADFGQSLPYQYVSSGELHQFGIEGELYNNLLVVQNFMAALPKRAGIEIEDYRGDLTTNFPLTCVVLPGEAWEFHLLFRDRSLSREQVNWLREGLHTLCAGMVREGLDSLPRLVAELPDPPGFPAAATEAGGTHSAPPYAPPRNEIQLGLVRIWEDLLPAGASIGLDDNFFHSGGTSTLALRLFARIEKTFGRRLPPSELIGHPTIRQLAGIVGGKEAGASGPDWSMIVPLRARGGKVPLVCPHAGEGHVFFFQPLARRLDAERPVFAIQPAGLGGETSMHATVEEMATAYIRELRQIYPQGPLALFSYCFGAAVCLEMARQLVATEGEPPLLFVVDNAPRPEEVGVANAAPLRRKARGPRWFARQFYYGRWTMAVDEVADRFVPVRLQSANQRARIRYQHVRRHLFDLYEKYTWATYPHRLILLRSSNYLPLENRNYVEGVWRDITGDRVEICYLPIRHIEMMREPDVAVLAEQLEAYLTAADRRWNERGGATSNTYG